MMARVTFYAPWVAAAAALLLLPVFLKSGTALTMMCLMGITLIFSLSYNILLGQTGLLSFGHAVYYGLGAYFTVHAINAVIKAQLPIPLPVLPLVGGAAGLAFGAIFGWVSTKRSGTAFAMISLGLAELVGSSSLILRSFFGGEEGITTNRTKLLAVMGYKFGPQIQVYYLIAVWCLIAGGLMYALTRTPFGRMCNAVRENPQRVSFVGYNPHIVRYLAFCFSGLFAGIAGALASINFEIANSALFGATQSGIVLLATFVGGVGHFAGPIIGAVLVTYLQNMLSDVTEIWQLYFGVLFIATVAYAPGGVAGLIMMHAPMARAGTIWRVLPAYVLALVPALVAGLGCVLVIEFIAHLTMKSAEGPTKSVFGMAANLQTWEPWAAAVVLIAIGAVGFKAVLPIVARARDEALSTARTRGFAA